GIEKIVLAQFGAVADERWHREQKGKLVPDTESFGQFGEPSEQALVKWKNHVPSWRLESHFFACWSNAYYASTATRPTSRRRQRKPCLSRPRSMRHAIEIRDRGEVVDPCLLRANKYLPAWHQLISLAQRSKPLRAPSRTVGKRLAHGRFRHRRSFDIPSVCRIGVRTYLDE